MSKNTFFLLLLMAFARALSAQEPAPPDTVRLEEVVVTASKVPLPLRETAKPVQVIRREDILLRPARDLSQVLDDIVGLSVNGANSNPGLNKGLYLRGAGTSYTLILVNGQPLSDPSGVGGPVDLRLFPLDMIERIEVLKGSQSTLYGTDALAGVINIITRSESPAPFAVQGSLAYGSFNTLDASAGLQGKTGNLNYLVNYQHLRTDGISEALDTTGLGDFDRDGMTQQGLQVQTHLKIGSRIRLNSFFRWSDYKGDTDADAFSDAGNRYAARLIHPGAELQYDSRTFSARLHYGYNQTRRNFNTAFGDFPYEGRLHNAEATAGLRIREHLQLMGGIHLQRHGMLDTSASIKDPSITIASPFATLLARNVRGFSLEAGYRLNMHSEFGARGVFSLAPAYQVSESLRLFASYTSGFKAPTLYELYGAFGGNPELLPQLGASWETGLRHSAKNGKVEVSAAFFARRIKEIIVYNFSKGYFNQDQQNDYGIETEIRWKVNSWMKAAAHYAYTDGSVRTKDAQERDTSYYNLIRRPRHRIGFSLDLTPLSGLNLAIQGQYTGQRSDYFFNPARFYALEEVSLNPYLLVHSSISYQLPGKKAQLFASLRNLTNTSFSEIYGYRGMGFNAHAGVRIGW